MAKRKNGLGSIEQLPNGKCRMRKQVGVRPNGTPRIWTVTGSSETDCLKKMRARESREKGLVLDSDSFRKITLTSLCSRHLEEHLNELDRLKPKAADRRESTIKNQIQPYRIGRLQAHSVTPKDVQSHIESLIAEGRLSVSSIEKTLDVINAAYRWAVDQSYMGHNPCTPVLESLKTRLRNLDRRNSSDGIVRILSKEQVKMLEDTVRKQRNTKEPYQYSFGLSVLLLLYTGMRVGELCALRWRDWTQELGTLSIVATRNISKNRRSKGKGDTYIPNENPVKNYHSRTIALSEEAVEVLSEMKRISPRTSGDDYILLNRRGRPTNPSNYDSNIRGLYAEANLPDEISGAHILRRTCATKMHDEGCRIEDIAAYLGDAPGTIQKHYVSLTKRIMADGEVKNVVQLPRKQ